MTSKIEFDQGTIVLSDLPESIAGKLSFLKWDERTQNYRCRANDYRALVEGLIEAKHEFLDKARGYRELDLKLSKELVPRKHQKEALDAWIKAIMAGTVCLPTGGGKTILAVMAMSYLKRSTLVVVPTIDLMNQWQEVLQTFFACKIGMLGGGHYEICDLTVSTYDSAQMHIERIGDQFGFVVFDECHHLPGPIYQNIAICSLAPFRLGLSATVERADGKEDVIYELIGPLVYEGQVHGMIGQGLAPYQVVTIEVPMTDEELDLYQTARQTYISFIRSHRINMSHPKGWNVFLYKSSQSDAGRKAFRAYREQRKLSQSSENKLKELWQIIQHHQGDRMIVFTNDNALAYRIGQLFILPVLTHQTKAKERKQMLQAFKDGELSVLVTSKVLNEGVDVPEASVGVVVSGSSAIREHVQRLGRIIRAKEGKRATLYELVSKDTGEYFVNKRRKDHHAYQGSLNS